MTSDSTTLTREDAEQYARSEMERLFREVPLTREFHQGGFMEEGYYRRHLLETILRIRLNNEVDAYCLYRMGSRHDALAGRLAQYLAEEYGHDHMFLRDLKRFGTTKEQVADAKPFFSTELLIGYLYHAISHDGPMPTMVWNWFVEWYSNEYNLSITNAAADAFGAERVQGSLKHIGVDDQEDHVGLMFSTIEAVMTKPGDAERVKGYLTNFVSLIAMYFGELHDFHRGGGAGRGAVPALSAAAPEQG